MQMNEQLKKVVNIFILVLLCSELETSIKTDAQRSHESYAVAVANDSLANAQQAAHYAAIRLKAQSQQSPESGHLCAGALVAPAVVLTVAKCVQQSNMRNAFYHPAELSVVLGMAALEQDTLSYGITHIQRRHGLALLRLAHDVPPEHMQLQAIALPTAQTPLAQPLQLLAWTVDAALQPLAALRKLNATRVAATQCAAGAGQRQRSALCIRHEHAMLRPQDAGAALLAGNVLVGLKLHVGAFEKAALYVDVRTHAAWIAQQIGDGSNQNSAVWGTLGFLAFTIYAFGRGRSKAH